MMQYVSVIYRYFEKKNLPISTFEGEDSSFDTVKFEKPDAAAPGILYICDKENAVALHCGRASFSVFGMDIFSVSETVIDACSYYIKWEQDITAASRDSSDYQKIIDLSDGIFQNPIFICNWQGNVLGFSMPYKDEYIRDTWTKITHDYKVPLSSLGFLLESEYRKTVAIENSVHILDFPDRDFRSVFGLVHNNHEIVLQFQIFEYDNVLTEADLRLAEIFLKALRFSFGASQLTSHESAISIFKELLGGRHVSYDEIQWVLDYYGWDRYSQYKLVLMSSPYDAQYDEKMFAQIETYIPGCKLLEYSDLIVAIVPADMFSLLSKELVYVTGSLNLYAAVSQTFTDWSDLTTHFEQASYTLAFCTAKEPVRYCSNYTWQYLSDTLLKNDLAHRLVHPAVLTLRDYDKRCNSELCNTLYIYLLSERRTNETAAKLFIHRNTLLYRLRKIDELIDVDLEDPDIRMHLLISLSI